MKSNYLTIIAVLLASIMMVTACGAKSTQAEPSKTEQVAQITQQEETATNSETPSESVVAESTPQNEESPAQETLQEEPAEPEKANTMQSVEINMDNWQEYFEITSYELGETADGNVINFILALKEEYAESYLKNAEYSLDGDFETIDNEIMEYLLEEGKIKIPTPIEIEVVASYTNQIGSEAMADGTPKGALMKRWSYTDADYIPAAMDEKACARYLLANEGMYEDHYDGIYTHLAGFFTNRITDRGETIELATVEQVKESIQFEIKEISGILPVWLEE